MPTKISKAKSTRKPASTPLVLDATVRDFQALGTLPQLENLPQNKFPICLFAYHDYTFPLDEAVFDTIFACEVDPFNQLPDQDCEFATNMESNSLTVCEPTLIHSVYVILQTDTERWSLPVSTQPANAVAASQPMVTPNAASAGALNHGWPGNELVEAFSRLYNLRVMLCRTELMNEAVSNIGRLPADPAVVGAGQANKAVANEVRAYNQRLAAIGHPNRVLSQNVTADRMDCFGDQTVSVLAGGGTNTGVNKSAFKFACMVPILPGQPLKVQFVQNQDPDCIQALRQNSMITSGTPDDGWTDEIESLNTCKGLFTTYPMGKVRIGVAFCGVGLYPGCFAEYLANYCAAGSVPGSLMGSAAGQVSALIQRFGDPTGRLRQMLGAKPAFRDRLVQLPDGR